MSLACGKKRNVMKKIIVILGSNGVGKSTTAKILLNIYNRCAYVDSDWCRAINPFPFTEATKKTVTENIFCLFKNYLLCDDIDTLVFTYGLHGERREIFKEVIRRLKGELIEFEVCPVILKCSMEENLKRALSDGRDEERIRRGIKNTFYFYDDFEYPVIDSTELTPEQVAQKILEIVTKKN